MPKHQLGKVAAHAERVGSALDRLAQTLARVVEPLAFQVGQRQFLVIAVVVIVTRPDLAKQIESTLPALHGSGLAVGAGEKKTHRITIGRGAEDSLELADFGDRL